MEGKKTAEELTAAFAPGSSCFLLPLLSAPLEHGPPCLLPFVPALVPFPLSYLVQLPSSRAQMSSLAQSVCLWWPFTVSGCTLKLLPAS